MPEKLSRARAGSENAGHVSIDRTKCQGHGRCALIAPRYFDADDAGFGVVLVADVSAEDRADVEEAVLSCPENAIVMQ